jgi:hypothetical protein
LLIGVQVSPIPPARRYLNSHIPGTVSLFFIAAGGTYPLTTTPCMICHESCPFNQLDVFARQPVPSHLERIASRFPYWQNGSPPQERFSGHSETG